MASHDINAKGRLQTFKNKGKDVDVRSSGNFFTFIFNLTYILEYHADCDSNSSIFDRKWGEGGMK